jgi:hypothetical protein
VNVPYSKPTVLSDPFQDWCLRKEKLRAIIDSNPALLGDPDFRVIYYSHLPAANYEEGCFYVPHFLKFYSSIPPLECADQEGFFIFVNYHRNKFKQDNLLDEILEFIWNHFVEMTSSFKIQRLSEDEVCKRGMRMEYREVVHYSRKVTELLEIFTKYPVYSGLFQKLKNYFAEVKNPQHSLWYCECAYQTRIWMVYYLNYTPLQQELFDHFHRFSRFRDHFNNAFYNPCCKIAKEYKLYTTRVSPV